MPWFFPLGHVHYARWIPIDLCDMVVLHFAHADVHSEFLNGKFVMKKTAHSFSALAIDQAHEQNSASVKGDGGAVGLTENPAVLQCRMVSGPETARVIREFESFEDRKNNTRHNEHTKHVKMAFAQDVKALAETIEDMGNPFSEKGSDLLVLDTRDLADPVVIESLNHIKKLGRDQYHSYVSECLVSKLKPIMDPIPKNNLLYSASLQSERNPSLNNNTHP